jgi:hypothetical protein
MATETIDVPLPSHLKAYLARPKCADIGLPRPGKAQLTLPTGGQLKGLVDITKSIPDDCSLTFSLALQLGPFLASIECLMKLMKLIKPLIDVVKALENPADLSKLPSAVKEFIKAVDEVLPCILNLTGLGAVPFVKDLLCMLIKLLRCVIGQLKTIVGLMSGLVGDIKAATAEGNPGQLEALQCAQEQYESSAANVMTAIEPLTFLLSLAEPFLGMAGVSPITIPTFGSGTDMAALNQTITTLEELVKALQLAAEIVGGC